ncbi:hypothetical protein JTE90_015442 [Oedothorax gibbosus]|uniref:Uncharacterized protein n=1 Tax=Oedothorax gibbosus TaxID=931172 RepID=A0AAV6TH06_9ARAC|nr:hypothetical protein JTE90_015442 [Oedothorax gibbosus]
MSQGEPARTETSVEQKGKKLADLDFQLNRTAKQGLSILLTYEFYARGRLFHHCEAEFAKRWIVHPLIGERRSGFRPSRGQVVLTLMMTRRCDSNPAQLREEPPGSGQWFIVLGREASGCEATIRGL